MRKGFYVPMISLLLLLTSCSGIGEEAPGNLRSRYQEMSGCGMEAVVSCDQAGLEWEARLRCDYVPGGESTVEVLEPESIAGVKAVFSDSDWRLVYEDTSLNAGTLSGETLSPALCLPRLMSALREGWLLEENREDWQGISCVRMMLDQSGQQGGKILSTLWLREDDGMPLRGEIAVEGEIILTAEFTDFRFYDTIDPLKETETQPR